MLICSEIIKYKLHLININIIISFKSFKIEQVLKTYIINKVILIIYTIVMHYQECIKLL